MKNIIKINKKLLIFRDEAKAILKNIRKIIGKNKIIKLDFSSIDFISRSFADELLNVINVLKKEKITAKIYKLKRNPSMLLSAVRLSKRKIKKYHKV